MMQGSAEWHQARIGKVTASRIFDVVALTKAGKPTAARRSYLMDLVEERLTGASVNSFVSEAMRWGMEREPQAVAAYALACDAEPEECGFFNHPEIPMSGASPDRLVGADGLVEVKCPTTATHIETLRTRGVAARYFDQMQWQIDCTGRAWCDFVSFDPRVRDPRLQMFIKRVVRDDERIGELRDAVTAFLAQVDDEVTALMRPDAPQEAAE